MTVQLFQNTDEANKLVKTPTMYAEYTGSLRADCSITDPVITVEVNEENLNISLLNYAYIPEFYRYYFIKDIRVLRTHVWEISMHCDVLMSFAGNIKANVALIAKQENGAELMNDGNMQTFVDSYVYTKEFPNSLPSATYILAMIGGSTSD